MYIWKERNFIEGDIKSQAKTNFNSKKKNIKFSKKKHHKIIFRENIYKILCKEYFH